MRPSGAVPRAARHPCCQLTSFLLNGLRRHPAAAPRAFGFTLSLYTPLQHPPYNASPIKREISPWPIPLNPSDGIALPCGRRFKAPLPATRSWPFGGRFGAPLSEAAWMYGDRAQLPYPVGVGRDRHCGMARPGSGIRRSEDPANGRIWRAQPGRRYGKATAAAIGGSRLCAARGNAAGVHAVRCGERGPGTVAKGRVDPRRIRARLNQSSTL